MARIPTGDQIEGAVTLGGVDRKVLTQRFTAAQVRALATVARTLVPAPGAGKAVFPLEVQIKMDGATAFGGIAAGEDLRVRYDGATTTLIGIETTGFLNQTDRPTRVALTQYTTAREPLANTAIELDNSGVITGGSALIVTTYYREIDL